MIALLLPVLLLQAPPAERRVMLTGFDRVRVDGPFMVVIATGGGAAARIAGDAAALETVRLRVEAICWSSHRSATIAAGRAPVRRPG